MEPYNRTVVPPTRTPQHGRSERSRCCSRRSRTIFRKALKTISSIAIVLVFVLVITSALVLLQLPIVSAQEGGGDTAPQPTLQLELVDPPTMLDPDEEFTLRLRIMNLNASSAVRLDAVTFVLFKPINNVPDIRDSGRVKIDGEIGPNGSTERTVRFRLDTAVDRDEYELQAAVEAYRSGVREEALETYSVSVGWATADILFYLAIGIAPVVLGVILLFVRRKYRDQLPKAVWRTKHICPQCQRSFRRDTAIYCDHTDGYQRRCLAGPFCSDECLRTHRHQEHEE